MKPGIFKSAMLVAAGFAAVSLASNFPRALASNSMSDPSKQHFIVSIDEVKKNLVEGKLFRDHYANTITLSDGSVRTIELTPMLHDGKQAVEFKDNGETSYGGLNGTYRNGALVVQVRNQETARTEMEAEGWRAAEKK